MVAVGSSGMAESPANNSTQYSANIFLDSTYPADSKIKIKDSDGNTILRHTSAKTFSNITVSMAEFVLGETYILYIDDEKIESFTLSNVVTIVGNANNRFGGPGDMGPGGNMGPNNDMGPGMQGGDMTPPDGEPIAPPNDQRF